MYKELFSTARFAKLAAKGARGQRLLWASTSTKNPDYGNLKYVEALVGPETINTVTVETIDAYRDHGNPKLFSATALDARSRSQQRPAT
jgi:transaldolase